MGLLEIGYHLIIDREGCIHSIRDILSVGSHCPGYNHCSIGLCLIGGHDHEDKPSDNFTIDQWVSTHWIIEGVRRQWPGIRIRGHRELRGYKEGHSECPPCDMEAVRKWPRDDDDTLQGPTIQEMLQKHPKGPTHDGNRLKGENDTTGFPGA